MLKRRKPYIIYQSNMCCKWCGTRLLGNKKLGLYWCGNDGCVKYHYMIRSNNGKKCQSVHNRN